MGRLAALGGLLLASLISGPAGAAERLPIIDAHVHFSRPAWEFLAPDAVIRLFDQAGIVGALVSSTPDDGTLMLHDADPGRVQPMLRPYRTRADMTNWFRDAQVLAYVEQRLERGIYRGIGEFHLYDAADVSTPEMRRLLELARARDLILHAHANAGPIEALAEAGVKVLWAHAGLSDPPAVIGPLLDRHPKVWVDLSFRAGDIAPGGRLDGEWRALLTRHAGRFVIGTDTYVNERWAFYGHLIAEHRRWLALLPGDVARAIAYGNARTLLGLGPGKGGKWGRRP